MPKVRPHVLVLGGGFGGLHAARALSHAAVSVTVVDRRNHHLFLPLLYQVATAGLNPGDIARPIRRILRDQSNATVLLAEASRIEPAQRRVVLTDGELHYDYLIVATGARPSYFGHDDWAAHATGLGGLEDAMQIRRRLVLSYEAAERERDPDRRARFLTFVVVGGGPTGVELAGAISEMARKAMAREFRRIDPHDTRVILIEAGERVLLAFPPALSHRAEESLRRLGVDVRTGTSVDHVDDTGVMIGDERVEAATVVWGAGVSGSPLAAGLGGEMTRSGRVLVAQDLSLPAHPEIFVIGDIAAVRYGEGLVPGLAPAAIQMGRHAAANVIRRAQGRPTLPFGYRDWGTLATIGRSSAVAVIGRFRLSGFIAWIAWLTIHIYFLIGFRNRFIVLFQWAWAYWTYERGARLVTGAPSKEVR